MECLKASVQQVRGPFSYLSHVEVQNEDYKYLFHSSSFKNDETDDCIVVSKSEIFDLGLRFTFSGVEPRPPPSAP